MKRLLIPILMMMSLTCLSAHEKGYEFRGEIYGFAGLTDYLKASGGISFCASGCRMDIQYRQGRRKEGDIRPYDQSTSGVDVGMVKGYGLLAAVGPRFQNIHYRHLTAGKGDWIVDHRSVFLTLVCLHIGIRF